VNDVEITQVLLDARQGDRGALDRAYAAVYDELRRIARAQLRRQAGASLDTTALVHEVYLKLIDADRFGASDRAHFLALAARAMRQILVDAFRRRSADKRGGPEAPLPLDDDLVPLPKQGARLLELDDALRRLAGVDERLARVVELKFFGGMGYDEIATVLSVSPSSTASSGRSNAPTRCSVRRSPRPAPR
jgi:RNA polymerase sigma factor (TIGR02999 family)